jgi:uncharacterized membrane protein
MAQLTVHQAAITGTTLTFAAAAGGGDTVQVDGDLILIVRNTDGTTKTVTVVRPGSEYGQANPDIAKVVPATTGVVVIGPIPAEFADTDGLVDITYSAVTGVTIAAVRV